MIPRLKTAKMKATLQRNKTTGISSKFKLTPSSSSSSYLNAAVITVLFLSSIIRTCESDFSVPIDRLTESVKGMMDDGFSQQEIISTIKSELSLSRIKTLLGKMYQGEELTVEELERMRSGEIDDNDEELINILQTFGMKVIRNESMIHDQNATEGYHQQHRDTTSKNFVMNTEDDSFGYEETYESRDFGGGRKSAPDNPGTNRQPIHKPDYAYSPYDLYRLVSVEELIYKPLKRYIRKVEAKMKILKSYAKDIETTSVLITKNLPKHASLGERAEAIVSNPLTSYKLIKRFALKLPDVWKLIGEDNEEELWNDLSKIQMNFQPPNDQDWKDSIEALLRIQYFNKYPSKEIASGLLGPFNSGVKFTAQESMEIGLRALTLKQYDFALEWLDLATKKVAAGKEEDEVDEVDNGILEQSLQYAIHEHNNAWDNQNIYGKSHVFAEKLLNPVHIDEAKKMSDVMKERSKAFRTKEEYDIPVPHNFATLCSGEDLQTAAEKSRLHCWLERSKDAYFYISPMKMELLNEEPPLVQIYEVVGDKLISEIKQAAIGRLERSQVINYNNVEVDEVSLLRTSSQTWLHDATNKRKLRNLEKLIDKITGLETMKYGSSEDFQVACYGTSHHYEEHLDAVQDPRRTRDLGDRIATFMLYLSTVDVGGKTAFPVLGTSANAVKGSAVFWYNLKKNGEPDKRTWHGGCPVVHGIKWVMNKWILLYENFKKRPCGLTSDE